VGTSRTTAEFRRKVAALPSVVIEAERLAVRANAQLAKDNALRELRRHVPSQRLRNVGRNGTKLNVRYTIDRASGRSADVKAVGPWQFVEFDAKNVPYGVGSRYAKGSRKSRSAAILAGKYGAGEDTLKSGEKRERASRIASRTTASGRLMGGRKAMLRTPWGWRAYAKVTKKRQGRHPWRTAFEKTQREAPGVYQEAAEKALRKALRG
jgi:hypothetical protein